MAPRAGLAGLAVALAACFRNPVADGVYACGADDLCPTGYVCAADDRCRLVAGDDPPDARTALAPDAAPDRGFAPSNVPRDRVGAGAAAVTLDAPAVIDTDLGTIVDAASGRPLALPGLVFATVPQADGPAIGVFSVGSLRIASGVRVTVRGTAALAIAATDDITIAGTLDAAGAGAAPGAGGGAGGAQPGAVGEGPAAGQTCATPA
ncbi:MAG: hypothetical protein K8W52_45485, partial [Deltaproteobacteria bacterium]|nr:hypothetical protein [Deltaproteobacteria bacterium]